MPTGLIAYGLDRPLTGIGRYTVELARALAARPDIAPVLLAAGGLGPLAGDGSLRHAALRGCRLLPALLTLGQVQIPLLARRLGLDLVHDPTGVAPFLFGAGSARTVVTVHDAFPWSCPGHSTALDTLVHRRWLPRVLPRVDAVITDSQASKGDLVRFLGLVSEQVHVIYGGVEDRFRPAGPRLAEEVRRRHRLPERYVLFLGSAGTRKNLAGLLRAYSRLRAMGSGLPLVVAGPANARHPALAGALHRLSLESHVHFAGYVPDADLPALYSAAELLVFPSLYEGFGLPPLEAMACGTPVVCSNTSSLPEVVGDAALTVDPTDVDGLADAMLRVLTGPDLAADLRRRGLARAAQFTWERTARETVLVYQRCTSERA